MSSNFSASLQTSSRQSNIARPSNMCHTDLGLGLKADILRTGNTLVLNNNKSGEGILSSIGKFMAGDKSTARPGFKGEHHAILKLKNGVGRANYMGPGTHLDARLKRGDPPRTMEDKVAQGHDIRYGLAQNQMAVSNADRKMISKLKDMKNKKQGNTLNIEMGLRPIQAKLAMESRGLIKSGRIASFGDIKDGENKNRAMSKLKELEQEGYGKPADMLRKQLLKKMMKKHSPSKSMKRKSKKGRGLSLPGGGLSLPGGAMDKKEIAKKLSLFVLKKVVPVIINKLQSGTGLKLAGQGLSNNKKLKSIVEMKVLRHMNDGASRNGKTLLGTGIMPSGAVMKSISKDIAKTLLPLLINKVATVANKKISGMGMYGMGMCGGTVLRQSDFDNFKPSLTGKLTTGVLKSILNFFKKQSGMGAQVGEGFFSDFAKGFKKGFMGVMKPALKIAKTVAPLAPLLL
jgi:hypothetical protein